MEVGNISFLVALEVYVVDKIPTIIDRWETGGHNVMGHNVH